MDQGIHQLTAAQYHADQAPAPSLSNSLIKTLLGKSALHARLAHPRLNPNYRPYESDRFDLGTAAHAMLLEGQDNILVVDADDWRSKAAKEQRDNARASGITALLRRQYDDAKAMVSVAREFADKYLPGAFAAGKPEQAMLWQFGPVWCRGLVDHLSDDRSLIIDYKTTSASSPQDWMRSSMIPFGYDTQEMWYRTGVTVITGRQPDFVFLVQEDSAPYSCYLVECAESMRELAGRKIARAVDLWAQCLRTDTWPGYGGRYVAQAPSWAMTEELSRE